MLKKKVLLVEDEELLRTTLTAMLKKCELDVVEAEDEAGAIGRLADGGFNIVVTDLFLSNGSGLGIMKYIQERFPDTKCIMITGHASLDSAINALRKGAFDYLLKPFEYDELRSAVFRALQKQTDEKRIAKVDFLKIARTYGLTRKEIQIIKTVITEGLSNEEMAERLKISKNTVKVHLRNIFKKVGVESKTSLTTTLLSGNNNK